MFIDGFMISGYRSFGNIAQKVGFLGKINLIIGKNNSGKSNVIRFLKDHFGGILESAKTGKPIGSKFHQLDAHIGGPIGSLTFGFGVKLESDIHNRLRERAVQNERAKAILDKLLKHSALVDDEGTVWFTYKCNSLGEALKFDDELLKKLTSALEREEWRMLWNVLTGASGGDLMNNWIPQTLDTISPVKFIIVPEIVTISAIREIKKSTPTSPQDFSGTGIIDRLAKLQHPSAIERHLCKLFDQINSFLKEVIGNTTCKIEIPDDKTDILVNMDGKTLPLDRIGMGIYEVIILATAATILENKIICIEEPELHLHPSLQKKLISYLSKNTNNQYFITTHSVHLLDTANTRIFHIKNEDGNSEIDVAYTADEKSEICSDLGYHASDLLQSNSIIWVEGPSDRVYINYFINRMAPDLTEGVHYSIMFYGGKLLSHLTANDPLVNDFISLRRLNRNICVVMDSDISGSTKQINETKERIRNEFSQVSGFAWITKGREIENYIEPSIMEKAVKKIYGDEIKLVKTGPFDHCTYYKRKTRKIYNNADKLRIAREVVTLEPKLDRLGLEKKVQEVIDFIKQANSIKKTT